jgi:predicted nucleotidyltransferase
MMDTNFAVKLVKKYSPLFIKAFIFGSIAKGQQDNWSDLDLILVRYTDLSFPERAKEVLPLILETCGADVLIYTPEEFERQRRKNGFIQEILQESIEIEGEQGRSKTVVETGGK